VLRSIRVRLVLWYAALIAFTFLCLSVFIYIYLKRTLSSTLDQSVTNEVKWIVARLERQVARKESNQIVREDIFEHAAFYPTKEYVEIWDSTGNIFYRSPNLADDTLANHVNTSQNRTWLLATVTDFRNHDIRIAVRTTPTAIVMVAMPTETITTPLNYIFRILAWLGPVVIVIAVGVGLYLVKKSFVKINQVIETAKRISADRMHDRIPEHNVQDEVGKLISTFNEMISRLDLSFQQMKQFSADVSHELRTSLTVLRTQLESALESNLADDEMKEIVADCLDEALRMSTIVESLLLLARADAGQEAIPKKPVDLQILVRNVFEESVFLASAKSITVTLQQFDKAIVMGDEQRLRQMILNMIDNAIKYGHEHGRIQVGLTAQGGSAKITVFDDGIGIPENEIGRIFDRFYRVDRARSRGLGGSGLGLSISRWIAEAHGGQITVTSELNKGSVFTVLLPLSGV
jgi:two-component system, OmpR family, sensor kinase